MNIGAMRERLYDFIRVADDKKVRAMYMMLEDDIEETAEWWKDAALMQELEHRYEKWQEGAEKGYTLADIEKNIEELTE